MASAACVSAVPLTSPPIRGGRPPRLPRASQWSRRGPALSGRARKGSSSRSVKAISSRAASGWVSVRATRFCSSDTTVQANRSGPGTGSQTKATSHSPPASPAVTSSEPTRRSRTSAPGWAAASRERIAGSRPPGTGLALVPTTTVVRSRAVTRPTSARHASQAASMARAYGRRASPATRQPYAPTVPGEQLRAQLLLQGADLLTQGGLRHEEPLSRPGEVELLRERCEVPQLA